MDPDIIEHTSSVEIAADRLSDGGGATTVAIQPVHDAEQGFAHLSPEQAVAEISELAGLPAGEDDLSPPGG